MTHRRPEHDFHVASDAESDNEASDRARARALRPRACAKINRSIAVGIGPIRAAGTGGPPERSNETDSRAVTGRLTRRSHTSYLQSTTSSQAQIKCSLYPPCFPLPP
jgi:hypothetical protein